MSEFTLIIKPDEEDAEAAEIFIDGTIGGNTYRFLLDTGAARTRVIWDDYTSTFDCIEKSTSSGVFARSSDDLITVPSIEVGLISKKDFTLVRTAENGPDRSNLIGMDLLTSSLTKIEFRLTRTICLVLTIRFKSCLLTRSFILTLMFSSER
jgi:predicted aspartyl protease